MHLPGGRNAPLSQALTPQYDEVIFILEPINQAKAAIGKRVTVIDRPDGRLFLGRSRTRFVSCTGISPMLANTVTSSGEWGLKR